METNSEINAAKIKKEFVIERQGKSFVLYNGLVDAAEQMGLKELKSVIIQYGSAENGYTWICSAIAVFEKDGKIRTFEDIADAAPDNVGPAMKNCLPRMASTRAKGRCLRDAVNAGATAFEELAEDENPRRARQASPSRGATPAYEQTRPAQPVISDTEPATKDQEKAVRHLCQSNNWDFDKLTPLFSEWSSKSAADWIREASKKPAARAA